MNSSSEHTFSIDENVEPPSQEDTPEPPAENDGVFSITIASNTVVAKTPVNEEDDVEKSVNFLLEGGDVKDVSPSLYPQIVTELTYLEQDQMINHEGDQAVRTREILDEVQTLGTARIKKEASQEYRHELRERLKQARDNYSETENKINKMIKSIRRRNKAQWDQLIKKQEEEKQKFVDTWHSPKKTRQFNRPSTELRYFRRRANILVLTGESRFINENQRDLEYQEAKETYVNQRLMEDKYVEEYKKLTKKHDDEQKLLKNSHRERIEAAVAVTKPDLEHAKRRVEKLERQLQETKDPDVVWNRKHHSQTAKISRPPTPTRAKARSILGQSMMEKLSLPPLPSPRTSSSKRRLKLIETF